ncbi:MAG TPA: hypothetical protein VFI95_01845 [Terriglobales bacterium]|nr:hypothetical protein [Terriglobales bacterium]
MRHQLKFAAALAGTVLLAGAALAQQQNRFLSDGGHWSQDSNGTLPAARNLRITTEFGSVRVRGGSESGITYSFHGTAYSSSEKARRQLDNFKINAYVRGDTAFITTEDSGGSYNRCSGEFVIEVPRSIDSVRIETQGGNVVVNGISGSLHAETGGGSIQVDDIGGSVEASTGGDSIEVGTVGGDAKLETGGGRITIRSVKGRINASTGGGDVMIVSGLQGAILESGGGNIQVKQCIGKVRVSTGGGNIDLGDISGPVEMETGGGSIRLASAKAWVRAETGAGRIELNGVPSARAETGSGGIIAKFIAATGERTDSSLETSAGDITVYLIPSLRLNIRASIDLANGHSIRSDFPEIKISSEGGDWGPREVTAEGNLNGGGPTLKLSTTTGDIRILRTQ